MILGKIFESCKNALILDEIMNLEEKNIIVNYFVENDLINNRPLIA